MNDEAQARQMLARGLLLTILSLCLAACIRIPPSRLQASATDYNEVLQRASSEQLLLNLVRLRYHDTPLFMEPSAVSAQMRRNVEVSAQAGVADATVTERSAGIGGRFSFSEQPTLTFVPMRGEAFMSRLLSRLDLGTLLLLYHSGWDIERVFHLCVESMNAVVNDTSVSGAHAQDRTGFYALLRQLHRLRLDGAIDLGYADSQASPTAMMSLSDTAQSAALFRDSLHLAPAKRLYRLELGTIAEAKDRGALVIGTRSVMGMLFFLSHGVEVPAGDEARVHGHPDPHEDGSSPPPAADQAGGFHVRYATEEPAPDVIRTRYRGHWFYVDDTDRDSKLTLMLLNQLFSIQSGVASTFAPVLTLPTGDAP